MSDRLLPYDTIIKAHEGDRSSVPDDMPENPVFMRLCGLFGRKNQETKKSKYIVPEAFS